jgi:hypothetical protein
VILTQVRRWRVTMGRMKRQLTFTAVFLAMAMTAAAAPVREIPGITGKDNFPHGCVDCHTGKPGMPQPIGSIIKSWSVSVDAKMLAKLQPFAPKGMVLKGKHPGVPVREVPGICFKCHAASKSAPPFAWMAHGIHLTGGDTNPYLTKFGGECTNCHKFDPVTAQWSMPTGVEK